MSEEGKILIFPIDFDENTQPISLPTLDKSLEEILKDGAIEGKTVFICTRRKNKTYKIQYKSIELVNPESKPDSTPQEDGEDKQQESKDGEDNVTEESKDGEEESKDGEDNVTEESKDGEEESKDEPIAGGNDIHSKKIFRRKVPQKAKKNKK